MTPAVLFYVLLALWTAVLVFTATPLKGKQVAHATIYELTDRLSWVIAGIAVAFTPLWLKLITRSYVAAVVVPIVGMIFAGALAQMVIGAVLSSSSLGALMRRLAIISAFILGLVLIIRWLMG